MAKRTAEMTELEEMIEMRDPGLADIDQATAIAKMKEAMIPGGTGKIDVNIDQEMNTKTELTTEERRDKTRMNKVERKELYVSTLWKTDVSLVKIVGLAMMKNLSKKKLIE